MPSVGQFLIESMKKSGAGIRGTPSEMTPETIGKSLAAASRTKEIEPEKRGLLPSWARSVATGAAMLPTSIGSWLLGKMGKRLFTKPAKVEGKSYQDRASKIVVDLQGRGYDEENIQKVLDVLANAYGEEAVKVEDYRPY